MRRRAAAVAWRRCLLIILVGIVNFLVTRRIATSNAQPRPPRWVRRRQEARKRLRAEDAMSAQRSAAGTEASVPTAASPTDRRKR